MAEMDNMGLCEECGAKPAVYTVSVMMGQHMQQRRLCPDCMSKMNMNLSAGNVARMLGAIMHALTGQEAETVPAVPKEEDGPDSAVVCQGCGTTLGQFTKSGKLGCPACYTAFRERLIPMLQQLHGQAEHTGRKPTQDEAAQRRRSVYERLTHQLETAVAQEDYETAAVIRDQLRSMDQEGGGKA